MNERGAPIDAWHDERTLTDLQWRARLRTAEVPLLLEMVVHLLKVEINVECLSVQFHIVLLL